MSDLFSLRPSLSITPKTKHANALNLAKKKLRAEMRLQRRALNFQQQKTASRKLISNLKTNGLLQRHQHIALYLANDGEISPNDLIPQLHKFKKQVYLPVIHPLKKQQMVFCQITSTTKFQKNSYGIEEPIFKFSRRLPAKYLSLVFMPLVAFDENGNRMGMGGGFYDRSFEFKLNEKKARPRLIGLAHDFQKQALLPLEPWDIPLHGIMTEKQFYA